jgi:hypothetical protein
LEHAREIPFLEEGYPEKQQDRDVITLDRKFLKS